MNPLLRRLRRLAGPDEPDAHLLRRHAAGDATAVEELVRRHGPLVWAAARRRLPDPADAADVFQATFLLLLQRAPGLNPTVGVGPWLYRVAALTARNLRRKNARRLARRRPLFDLPASTDPQLAADLDDALLLLGERDRAAVVLCHLQGFSRHEAAERLGLPEGTLSSVLNRALARLRARLGDPLPLLAAGTLAVPAGLTVAANPHTLSLAHEVFRMFWLKKLVAGGLATAACLGLGVGVGLAPRPAAAVAADPPKKPADADDLKRLRAEADMAAMRAEVAAALLKQAERELREKQAGEAKGPRITLRVSDENRPWNASIRLVETDAAGTVVADYGCGGGKVGEVSLATHLRRRLLDPAGRPEVVLEVSPKFDPFDLGVVAEAVVVAGFPEVVYTGPLPESWSKGTNQDGKPTRSWTGHKLVKGERVELARVLPLHLPPAKPLTYYVVETPPGGGEHVRGQQFIAGHTVLDAVATVPGLVAADDLTVFVLRAKGRDTETLAVDWVGITRKGATATNYRLLPGDRVMVKRSKR